MNDETATVTVGDATTGAASTVSDTAAPHDPTELDQFLRPALDATMRVARARAEEDGPAVVPARIRPFLRVPNLPRAGLTATRLTVEADADLRRAVAEAVDEDSLGRAPWLWVTRPEGWRDELDGLWEAWHEAHLQEAAEAEERSTRRLLERAGDTTARLDARVRQLEDILASTETDLARVRAECVAVSAARDEAVEESRRLGQQRAEAVRQLKAVEERLAARTAELRDARAAVVEPLTELEPELPREALSSAMRHVNGHFDELTRGLAALAALIGDDAEAATEPGGTRRRPVRVGRGIAEDSTSAAEVLISLPGSVTFVDGYNLTMTAWPTLGASDQRRALYRAATGVAARTGSEIHLVFDGDDGGGSPSRSTSAAVRMRFTSVEVEADDEILDLIGSVPLDRPVVVVSDDRRVRHGARARGANVVGSRQFQPLLLR